MGAIVEENKSRFVEHGRPHTHTLNPCLIELSTYITSLFPYMPQLTVRGLDQVTIDQLKARAKQHGRSLEAELRLILQQAAEEGT